MNNSFTQLISEPNSIADFRNNYEYICERIADAAAQASRKSSEIRLLPVSKTVPTARLRLAVEAGMTTLGENKVQEAKQKWQELNEFPINWTLIGHLQRNKTKDVAEFAHEFQALDSLRLAEELNQRLLTFNRKLRVYIQVNTSNEPQKSGITPAEVPEFLDSLSKLPQLEIQGFMTLAVFSDQEKLVRDCFAQLRRVRDTAKITHGELIEAGELSMGMSGDFAWAIAEGANIVRIGQAIFGAR
ncbi:MAG: YggS family pyridoxal phosphate-dependent enzyme [Arcanobacterium sp.]|nr:YggS family pyridoxal phosphate-dependent enzyme [Arcanobacterium sp.]